MRIVMISLLGSATALLIFSASCGVPFDWAGFGSNIAAELIGAAITIGLIEYYLERKRATRMSKMARRALQWLPLGIGLVLDDITTSLMVSELEGRSRIREQGRALRQGADEIDGFANIWIAALDVEVLDRCRRVHNHLHDIAQEGEDSVFGAHSVIRLMYQVYYDLEFILGRIGERVDAAEYATLDSLASKYGVERPGRYGW